ncbi:cell wall hydrolase/autolysin [Solidesulfovibrio fructosivorans JJ]]|uniref:N-acetylmuramoyl-L-alanine amidase n=1 Tax=Solidesulfovibrio fructosivorans JJ] TaxID=596151 RepID=E1JRL1_SOLFR|nr:N-acetylmuramoyl-L-alanine amidase [Solidesulfovibrio fructosivorans]EFL53212.1 cell wall hydrolase/autolysin [Solidesulfovibrio fructosivorans JJ]]
MTRRQALRLLLLSGALVAGLPGLSLAESSDELARSAQYALEAGDTDKALSLLNDAQAKDPRNDHVQALLGRTYFQRGDARAALTHFTLAVRLNPEDTLSRIMVETIGQFPLPPEGKKPGDAPSRHALPAADAAARAEREALIHPTAGDKRHAPLRLLIDPGHGGADVGAPGEGLRESDVTLDIALRLARILAASPQRVTLSLTRTADVSLPDWARAALAGFYGVDMLLSLHAARVPRPEAAGIAVYAYARTPSDALARETARIEGGGRNLHPVEASRAGQDIFLSAARRAAGTGRIAAGKRLAGELADALRQGRAPLAVAGGGSGPFPLLAAADAPAVLVELGFLSHPQDAAALAVPEKRQAMAEALALAVLATAGKETVGAP